MASAVSSHGGDSAPEPWSACVRVRRSHDRMGNLLAGIPVETVVRVSKVGKKAKAHNFCDKGKDFVLSMSCHLQRLRSS
jgi:hypothetical protein